MTFREVFAWLRTKVWRIERTRDHYKCVPPQGRFIVASGRDGDFQAVRNFIRDLWRIGGVKYPKASRKPARNLLPAE